MIQKQNWCSYDGDIVATEYYDTETKKRVLSDDLSGRYTGGTEEEFLELDKKYNEQFRKK